MFLWAKWLHILSIISWMAGILYGIRLFVYHAEWGQSSKEKADLLSLMEERLYRYITIPAMIASWTFGLLMISLQPGLLFFGWLKTKLFCVVLLSLLTLWSGRQIEHFKSLPTSYWKTGRFFRVFNEIPTLLMGIIVACVVFRFF